MHIPELFAQVNLIFTGAAVPTGAQVTFGVDNTLTDESASDIGAAVLAAVTSSTLMVNFDSNASLSSILVKKGPPDTGASAITPSGLVGGQSGTAQVPQSAVLIRKETAVGGRTGRGRMFWPAIADTSIVEGGHLTGVVLGNIQTDADAFLAALDTAGLPMVLLHTDPSRVPDLITSLAVQSLTATQRRRLRR